LWPTKRALAGERAAATGRFGSLHWFRITLIVSATALAGLIPSIRSARASPVDALRAE
jgi:hypothetical protein